MAAVDKFIPYYSTTSDSKSNRPPIDKDVRRLNRRKTVCGQDIWRRGTQTNTRNTVNAEIQ